MKTETIIKFVKNGAGQLAPAVKITGDNIDTVNHVIRNRFQEGSFKEGVWLVVQDKGYAEVSPLPAADIYHYQFDVSELHFPEHFRVVRHKSALPGLLLPAIRFDGSVASMEDIAGFFHLKCQPVGESGAVRFEDSVSSVFGTITPSEWIVKNSSGSVRAYTSSDFSNGFETWFSAETGIAVPGLTFDQKIKAERKLIKRKPVKPQEPSAKEFFGINNDVVVGDIDSTVAQLTQTWLDEPSPKEGWMFAIINTPDGLDFVAASEEKIREFAATGDTYHALAAIDVFKSQLLATIAELKFLKLQSDFEVAKRDLENYTNPPHQD